MGSINNIYKLKFGHQLYIKAYHSVNKFSDVFVGRKCLIKRNKTNK